MLYWRVGKRIDQEILKGNRTEYGENIVHALSTQLQREYGQGFTRRNLLVTFKSVGTEQSSAWFSM